MNKSRQALVIIMLVAFPIILLGEPANKTKITTCPDNLKSALQAINKNLNNKQWINMDLAACPHIQSEIIEKVDEVLDSPEFNKYLALMNQKTMRIVRNSFFARKGYKFDDSALMKHFTGYTWYKPLEKLQVVLTDEENHKVRLLKSIEEKWIGRKRNQDKEREPQPLPPGVNILQKKDKAFLKIGKDTLLDITRVVYGEGQSENYYKVYGNMSQNKVLLCSHSRLGDSRNVDNMSLYSANGSLLFNFANKNDDYIGGFEQCPQWTSQRPNILISYNNAGCCGAIWDVLVEFDETLKPIAELHCREGACGGTDLFTELNENNIYLSVSSQGGHSLSKNKSGVKQINYDGLRGSLPDGKYTNNWGIWSIGENGDLKLVVEAVETVHDKPSGPGSWYVIKDILYPTVTLMDSSNAGAGEPPSGDVLTSVKLGTILILYRRANSHYGTTMIPLP
ncbi:MAG: YARHG domain-containing protein [Nitrospirota bacterium]